MTVPGPNQIQSHLNNVFLWNIQKLCAIKPLGTNFTFSEIWIKVQSYSYKKMNFENIVWKMAISSWPQCFTWNNSHLWSVKSHGIHLRALLKENLKIHVLISITKWKLHLKKMCSDLPVISELYILSKAEQWQSWLLDITFYLHKYTLFIPSLTSKKIVMQISFNKHPRPCHTNPKLYKCFQLLIVWKHERKMWCVMRVKYVGTVMPLPMAWHHHDWRVGQGPLLLTPINPLMTGSFFFFFQNVILFSDAVRLMCNIFIWNWPNTINV